MCNDRAAALCEPCMPYQSASALGIVGPARHLPHQIQYTGDSRLVTDTQHGVTRGWHVLAASLTRAQLWAV